MLTTESLSHFSGSEHLYRHALGDFQYTDGVRHVAVEGRAFWLLDCIGSYQMFSPAKEQPFQVWELVRIGEGSTSAVLTMTDGNSPQPIIEQVIEYTDFPLESVRFYLTDGTLILPGEY